MPATQGFQGRSVNPYVMVFRKLGMLEVLILIILAVSIRYLSDSVFKRKSKPFDYIYTVLITLALFFGFNRPLK